MLDISQVYFFTLVLLFLYPLFKKSLYLYSLITLPATFMHELMHLIVSYILYGMPVSMSLMPKKTVEGKDIYYSLGSVTSVNLNWYNALFIGFAPIGLYYFLFLLYEHVNVLEFGFIDALIYSIIASQLLIGGIPSGVDVEIAFKHSIIPFIIIGVSFLLIYGARI